MVHKNPPVRWPDPPALTLLGSTRQRTEAVPLLVQSIAEHLGTTAQFAATLLTMALHDHTMSLLRLSENLRPWVNTPVTVAGIEGRYFVRAALDPTCATPEARDALVHTVLVGDPGDARLMFLTPQNRALVAVAAIRGWVAGHGDEMPASIYGAAWHRQMGSTIVRVSHA